MEIHRFNYSRRHGYSFELRDPSGFTYSLQEAYILSLILQGHPTEEEIYENFKSDEIKVIEKYYRLMNKNFQMISEGYNDKKSLSFLKRTIKTQLDWWLHYMPVNEPRDIKNFLGWSINKEEKSLNMIDRLIREALEAGRHRKDYYRYLLGKEDMGEPSLETMALLEKEFGPLDEWLESEPV